ncbi:PEP-CTERM sorting domain-containing protein [Azohydromonas sp. G-1-1-14]|uniref:PEP-CTERM sorting domain-containing protein n=1 Tax=Azohydromonas caseinilytica TaxID=2728836 RepID=A0A848FJZ5_9BURK|nr:PEP-CTERM sorting domain-containing protein [Azohydromonas caseinilytica]
MSAGLSDAGHIVGFGTYNGRVQRSFLVTPVPEPGTVVLMLAGLDVVGGAARRLAAPSAINQSR